MAVLGAAAGLEADDALDLDLGTTPFHPDLVRQGQQVLEAVVGKLQDLQHLIAVQTLPTVQHLLAGQAQNVLDVQGGLRHRENSSSVRT